MTAPDQRLDRIQARAKNPTYSWPYEMRQDIAYLLAELRKAHEALDGVAQMHTPMAIYELDENGHVNSDDESKYVRSICPICSDSSVTESLDDGNYDISGEWGEVTWPCPTAAAVAAEKGDERG